MSASDEFKQQLREGKIGDALVLALSEAVELEITTWVSTSESEPQPGYRMRTRMNIIDGDIDNEVGSQFIGDGPYTELRDFHLDQVKEGRQIIKNNLESIQQMFVTLTNTLSQLPPSSRRIALPASNQNNL